MNSFYHQFSVGFNIWFVVFPLMIVAMATFGLSKYKLDKTTLAILGRDKGNVLMSVIAVAFDVVLHLLIIFESSAGLLQFITNHLTRDDSPIWAVVLVIVGFVFSAFMVYYLLFYVGKMSARLKIKQLKKQIRRVR